jgi:hypothetical protein
MQEFPDVVYRYAGSLSFDSKHARHKARDFIDLRRSGILNESDVFSISKCVTGAQAADTPRSAAHLPVGAEMYDLFVAQALWRPCNCAVLEINLVEDN